MAPARALSLGFSAGSNLSGTASLRHLAAEKRKSLQTAVPIRYLGLDIGSKRIGVAVSDELGLTAQPVLTLDRKRNPRDDMRSLARLCRRFSCSAIVAGDPLHLSGEASPQGEKTRTFALKLGQLAELPVHFWDERLTSRAAHEILYQAGKTRQEHVALVDQVAAVLILQSFLDARRDLNRGEDTAESSQ